MAKSINSKQKALEEVLKSWIISGRQKAHQRKREGNRRRADHKGDTDTQMEHGILVVFKMMKLSSTELSIKQNVPWIPQCLPRGTGD